MESLATRYGTNQQSFVAVPAEQIQQAQTIIMHSLISWWERKFDFSIILIWLYSLRSYSLNFKFYFSSPSPSNCRFDLLRLWRRLLAVTSERNIRRFQSRKIPLFYLARQPYFDLQLPVTRQKHWHSRPPLLARPPPRLEYRQNAFSKRSSSNRIHCWTIQKRFYVCQSDTDRFEVVSYLLSR